jgi:membrane-bound lytic murein transglycosylase B
LKDHALINPDRDIIAMTISILQHNAMQNVRAEKICLSLEAPAAALFCFFTVELHFGASSQSDTDSEAVKPRSRYATRRTLNLSEDFELIKICVQRRISDGATGEIFGRMCRMNYMLS